MKPPPESHRGGPATASGRLAELASRYALPPGAEGALAAYLELLDGDAHAPTAVRDPARAVDTHVADALSGLEVEAIRSAGVLADLGAGAGAPGLVLAAASPSTRVVLVESTARKCAFLRGAISAMGLANAEVVTARAEDWADGRGACDVVTARALASLPVVVEYAAPLLRAGGTLVAWKGAVPAAEREAGAAAAEILGLEEAGVLAAAPFPGASNYHLYLYLKVRSTPNVYPRRAGVARKRPLGASTGA